MVKIENRKRIIFEKEQKNSRFETLYADVGGGDFRAENTRTATMICRTIAHTGGGGGGLESVPSLQFAHVVHRLSAHAFYC